jgi:2-methylcitrate dehydratase PrpD
MNEENMAEQGSVSTALARHIERVSFSDLPVHVVDVTKRSLLDAIGVSLAASGLAPEVRPFVEIAKGSGGRAEASILGFGGKTSAAFAAFANGAMAHAVDYEDSFDANPCHPNASLVPAALAIAEARGVIDGSTFLSSMAVGCDLVCRIGLSLRQTMEESGWYPPPILGAFGAVAAAAKLRSLSADQIKDALSLALCQVTCSGEIKHSARSEIRAVREAFPAQAAVISTELALRGVKGFEAPLDGQAGFFRLYVDDRYDPDILLSSLGQKFYGEDVSFKPWPSCRGTHAFVEACLELCKVHDFDLQDIAEVRLEGGEFHEMLMEPRPQKVAPTSSIDAKFSLPFSVATALKSGEVSLDSFSTARRSDAETLALAAKVRFRLRDDWGRDRGASGNVIILLNSGETLRQSIPFALGHPENPMTETQLMEKFKDCAARAAKPIDSARMSEVAERILNLDAESDVGRVLSRLSP